MLKIKGWSVSPMKVLRIVGLAVLVVLAVTFGRTFAQQPDKALDTKSSPPLSNKELSVFSEQHALTAPDLEAFLDGLLPAQLEREDIAGAVVAVVKDGKVLFTKGYGFSDVAKRKPVSPTDTLFRPGSITKLFTWTAVMQLVEQGRLDLDRDVNDYLDFRVPNTFGKPLTLRNIMTHTPGFEEAIKDLFVADAARIRPLGEYLRDHLPAQIFPPGVTPAYSNYATSLAGYIVERASGKPFDQYVMENIYTPLAMNHTTFDQPLPANLLLLMSNGYERASKEAKPYEFVQAYPAGSVATSALDMCNFMVAHLQDGQFGGSRILKPETAKLMHTRAFGADARLPGMALGFYEETRNGHRIIGHAGDTQWFHSDLHLILDANTGFFISYNSAGKGEVSPRTILFQKFLDRYFPYMPPPARPVASASDDARQVAGFYIVSRGGQESFLKVVQAFGQAKVFPNADGTLSVNFLKLPNGELKRYEEISPLLYREVHGQDLLGFHRTADGRMEFSIDYPFMVFQRASGISNKFLNLPILVLSLICIAIAVLFWPINAAIRWHYGAKLDLTVSEKRLRLATRLACIVNLLVVLGWAYFISKASQIASFSRDSDSFLYFVEFLGVVAALCTLVVLLNAFRSWTRAGKWIWAKLFDVALALACVGFSWFIWHWNMINFHLRY